MRSFLFFLRQWLFSYQNINSQRKEQATLRSQHLRRTAIASVTSISHHLLSKKQNKGKFSTKPQKISPKRKNFKKIQGELERRNDVGGGGGLKDQQSATIDQKGKKKKKRESKFFGNEEGGGEDWEKMVEKEPCFGREIMPLKRSLSEPIFANKLVSFLLLCLLLFFSLL